MDDGLGMGRNELIEAMRPGTKNPLDSRDENDLGRFGLGLKTASFSQCRKLTVVSSKNSKQVATVWDLDYVAKTEDWSLQILDSNEISILYKISELNKNGTLVLWEETDRIVDNSVSDDNEDVVYEKIENLQKHLELVFHRYLKGKDKINIFINGTQLKPFDPFFSHHRATQELADETITLNNQKIKIIPYILPHYSKVSAKDYEYYAGNGGYLKNQGFYVYRNRRLLISGTWFRLIPQSEMYKLARIQIDLPNNLDDLWKIDVKKSKASPPLVIRQRLKKIIAKIAGSSTRVYKGRSRSVPDEKVAFWERISARGEIKYLINQKHPIIENFVNKLKREERYDFEEILKLISDFFPKDTLYADIGNNNPNSINKLDIPDIELEEMAKDKILKERDFMSDDEFINYFKSTEPFSVYTNNWKEFLKNKGSL